MSTVVVVFPLYDPSPVLTLLCARGLQPSLGREQQKQHLRFIVNLGGRARPDKGHVHLVLVC